MGVYNGLSCPYADQENPKEQTEGDNSYPGDSVQAELKGELMRRSLFLFRSRFIALGHQGLRGSGLFRRDMFFISAHLAFLSWREAIIITPLSFVIPHSSTTREYW
jgi:hypothetical protein